MLSGWALPFPRTGCAPSASSFIPRLERVGPDLPSATMIGRVPAFTLGADQNSRKAGTGRQFFRLAPRGTGILTNRNRSRRGALRDLQGVLPLFDVYIHQARRNADHRTDFPQS